MTHFNPGQGGGEGAPPRGESSCTAIAPFWDKQKTRQIGRDWNTLIQLNKANKAQISGELFRETLRPPVSIWEEKQEKQENNKSEIVQTPLCSLSLSPLKYWVRWGRQVGTEG